MNMVNRKLQSKRRYLKSFVVATLVFILGFAMSYGVSYVELSRINDLQQSINYEIFSDKLDYSLFGEDICSIESYNEISQDLGIQGRIIDDLENRFGKKDRSVLFRKEFYTLALIEHFEFVKERNMQCDDGQNAWSAMQFRQNVIFTIFFSAYGSKWSRIYKQKCQICIFHKIHKVSFCH